MHRAVVDEQRPPAHRFVSRRREAEALRSPGGRLQNIVDHAVEVGFEPVFEDQEQATPSRLSSGTCLARRDFRLVEQTFEVMHPLGQGVVRRLVEVRVAKGGVGQAPSGLETDDGEFFLSPLIFPKAPPSDRAQRAIIVFVITAIRLIVVLGPTSPSIWRERRPPIWRASRGRAAAPRRRPAAATRLRTRAPAAVGRASARRAATGRPRRRTAAGRSAVGRSVVGRSAVGRIAVAACILIFIIAALRVRRSSARCSRYRPRPRSGRRRRHRGLGSEAGLGEEDAVLSFDQKVDHGVVVDVDD